MNSKLIITSVEKLQDMINKTVRSMNSIPGIYISLNKTQKSTEAILMSKKIKTNKIPLMLIFFSSLFPSSDK